MTRDADTDLPGALREALAALDPGASPASQLARLVELGLDRLPLPARGATLARWQALAAVAEHDLSLAKLYEGHTDALAILAELGQSAPVSAEPSTWGVWAAEVPNGRATLSAAGDTIQRLDGAKCWCSGAASATHALLTAWMPDDPRPQLVAIELRQPGVQVRDADWHAIGMARSASLDVSFQGVDALPVGAPGAYLQRPGFWQGGAGIAACWYGGALAIAGALRRTIAQGGASASSPFRLAALGRVELALAGTASLLREAAEWIDSHAQADASAHALRVRLAADATATLVLAETGRTLGAAAFCRDAAFARMAADLPVFIRQSHAERDLAALGERVMAEDAGHWLL